MISENAVCIEDRRLLLIEDTCTWDILGSGNHTLTNNQKPDIECYGHITPTVPISATCGSRLLLLPSTKTQRFSYAAKAETTQQLVDTQATEQTVDDTTQAQTIEKFADETENTAEEKTDSGNDLEERLGEQAP